MGQRDRMRDRAGLSWLAIARLGLVQASLGSVVVLATSTLNRVMVVELALPAIVPGMLVALHYLVQLSRPRFGYGSDVGRRRTPWIVGGMALLALGGWGAACATALMSINLPLGIAAAIVAFVCIGLGVGAAGTSLLILLALRTEPHRRPAAASIAWIMMIFGFVVTAGTAGHLLDPFSYGRLVWVSGGASLAAFALSLFAVWGMEGPSAGQDQPASRLTDRAPSFTESVRQVWREPKARDFTIFVFLSMLGYSAQELVLEPFAGAVFHLTPAGSAALTSIHNGGALCGMVLVAVASQLVRRSGSGIMRLWTLGGCLCSALGLTGLALAGLHGPGWPLAFNVWFTGAANGAFAVAAIGAMMSLVSEGRQQREGVRMGLWGGAQAVAFAVGGMAATIGSDAAHRIAASSASAYAVVFIGEAVLFLFAAHQATRVFPAERRSVPAAAAAATQN